MNTPKHGHTNPLLTEGAKSYPQALAALWEFRRLTQATCRKVMEADLRDLASAMKVDLNTEDIGEYANSESDIDGDFAALGVQIIRKGTLRRLHYHLCWLHGQITANTSIRLSDRLKATNVFDALQSLQQRAYPVTQETRDVYISRLVSADEINSIDEVLEDVSREWIDLWRRTGGLKKFIAKAAGA